MEVIIPSGLQMPVFLEQNPLFWADFSEIVGKAFIVIGIFLIVMLLVALTIINHTKHK